jgi:hypothetical protein
MFGLVRRSSERRRIRLGHGVVLRREPAHFGPVERGAVRGQRWPVGDRLARYAMPDRVAATVVTGAGDVPDQRPIWTEPVAVGAVRRWLEHPLAAALDQVSSCHVASMRHRSDACAGSRLKRAPATRQASRSLMMGSVKANDDRSGRP